MNLHSMTQSEINAIVFEGATTTEPRGLRDRLSDEEIMSLLEHPCYQDWPTHWTDWIWSAVDEIISTYRFGWKRHL